MTITARLAIHSAAPDRRSKSRIATSIPVKLSTPGYFGELVTVNNISLGGFELSVGAYIPPGSVLRLHFPGLGMVLGRVIWSKRGQLGGTFINPMSEQRLFSIIGVRAAFSAQFG